MSTPKALIAEDEPLLREQLRFRLQAAWPELDICAEAENGEQALRLDGIAAATQFGRHIFIREDWCSYVACLRPPRPTVASVQTPPGRQRVLEFPFRRGPRSHRNTDNGDFDGLQNPRLIG